VSVSGEARAESSVLVSWTVPVVGNAGGVGIDARAGEVTTFVGPNGAGKSALGVWLDQNSGSLGKRLIAHRRLWFQTAGPDMSPAQREQLGTNMDTWKTSADSRYLDHADGRRPGLVLFDVLAMINAQSQRMVARYQEGASRAVVESELGVPILDRLNQILTLSGLPVQLRLTEAQGFDALNSDTSSKYPINRMSDGEKSAVLLAAEIITSAEGRIFIIDEPERHLHRSISARLVDAVISDRPDSHFVVLTHDLDLAATLNKRAGQSLVVASCSWSGDHAVGWDLGRVDPDSSLPESAQLAILGGRRQVLFIEGDDHSLDRRLYELLFPGWTLFAAGGSEQVVRAVTGLKASATHHWIQARGVVDGDGRDDGERQSLLDRGILSLPVSEVENLYYLDGVIKALAAVQAKIVDGSAAEMHQTAVSAALDSLTDRATLDRLASALAVAELRRKFVDSIPTTVDGQVDPIDISIASPYGAIRKLLGDLADAGDYDGLVALAPVRDTALRSRVSASLGFRSMDAYETAVRVQVRDDESLAEHLRGRIGHIPA
jgi:ABC-type oligopeptide transport system ATPase subunit